MDKVLNSDETKEWFRRYFAEHDTIMNTRDETRSDLVTYQYGTTTELVYRRDIQHMVFSRFDLFDRGWTERDIKHDLGPPDYRVRQGRYNTGPVYYWKAARVKEIEVRLGLFPHGGRGGEV
jgi:hypothetical protein